VHFVHPFPLGKKAALCRISGNEMSLQRSTSSRGARAA
jgi:hypothetical protein